MLSFAIHVVQGWMLFFGIACVLIAAELAFPKGDMPPVRARVRAILFVFVSIPVAELVALLARCALSGVGPGLVPHSLIQAIAFGLAAVLLADFFYYWLHRAQHSIPLLWRFHAVHHSIRNMGAGSGYHHVIEEPLKAVAITLPMAFIVHMPGAYVAALLALHGNYIHSVTRINFGPLAAVIADNRTHRIHHSLEPRHFDKNFGALTMLWDWLFGTADFPRPSEWPRVGLDQMQEPETIQDYLLAPAQLLGTNGSVGTV